ncbi:MAG: hypothetical protein ABUK18_09380 [Candidatus Bathyarchaeia archaeon]|jgi:hypothetical protein
MGKCDICGSEQVKTYTCKTCEKDFCVKCGASHKKTCYTCKPKGSGGFLKGLFGR